MPRRILRCAIEEVADWHPRLFLEPHIIAAAAVLSRYSSTPALCEVECENIKSRWLGRAKGLALEVSWNAETADKADRLRLTMQSRPVVEMAAIALAMILVDRVAPLGPFEVTRYGERADYLSPTTNRVLEVSGTESLAELGRREREKVAQALANPFGWDACVVVCAFSAVGHRIRFSEHFWEGTARAEYQE